MALVKCPECNNEVSDKAKFCPNCGYPINEENNVEQEYQFCMYCGIRNFMTAQYCQNCGKTLASSVDADNEKSLVKSGEQERLDDFINNELSSKEKDSDLQSENQRSYNAASCPICGSTAIVANKKGYGIGKGLVGVVAVGPLGLLAGGIGANKLIVTCLNCGHRFERQERNVLC